MGISMAINSKLQCAARAPTCSLSFNTCTMAGSSTMNAGIGTEAVPNGPNIYLKKL